MKSAGLFAFFHRLANKRVIVYNKEKYPKGERFMTALILEGGGMRGLFTSGVLDAFLDEKIEIPTCYGVSAGACNATSYYSHQRGRSRAVNINYVNDKRYMSWDNFFSSGSLFSEKMMFHAIPERLIPFDYEAYKKCDPDSIAVCTSMITGRPVYIRVPKDLRTQYQPVLASMSLPLISKPVPYKGDLLLDGGIADPIPAERAIRDGADKLVVVLTRQKGYVKEPESTLALSKVWYHEYPSFLRTIARRHEVYNASVRYVEALEEAGKAVVIRPARPVLIARTEKDVRKLNALYQEGYNEAIAKMDALKKLLSC